MRFPSALSKALGRVFITVSVCACCSMIVMAQVAVAQPSSTPFALEPGSFHVVPSTFQAGAHENLTTSYELAHNAGGRTFNDLKTTVVNLPPGYIGNNTAVPTCPAAELISSVAGKTDCPADSQVGTISLDITYPFSSHPVKDNIFPIYNMEVTGYGVTTQLGFNAFVFVQLLNVSVRPDDYGLTVTAPDTVDVGEPHDISVTIWGVPASHEHDAQRGMDCVPESFQSAVASDCTGGGQTVNIPPKPFLSVPTTCSPTTATIEVSSWEEPERVSREKTEIPATSECDRVPFAPSIEVQPTTRSAESPTGLDVSLLVPQTWENPDSIATSNLEGCEGRVARRDDGQPVLGGGSRCVHAGAVRSGNGAVAPRRGLPGGIEDRVDRNRNAAARGKDPRRDLYRHTVR